MNLSTTETYSLKAQLINECRERTSKGVIFDLVLASIFLFFLKGPSHFQLVWRLGLWGLIVAMIIRLLHLQFIAYFKKIRLPSFEICCLTSIVSTLFWTVVCWSAFINNDMSGEGVTLFITFVAFSIGKSHALASVLWLQRASILILNLGMNMGMIPAAIESHEIKYLILGNLLTIYSLSIGKNQHKSLVLLFSQQERIRKDLSAARDIQMSLLPATDHKYKNTSLEILYRPSEELSGDFFEILEYGDSLLFYLADVTSHGTASAQVTFLLKGIFKSLTAMINDPIDIADFAEKIASEYITYKLEYAVSFIVCHYQMQTGELRYVSSSFPDMVLISDQQMQIVAGPTNPYIDVTQFDGNQNFTESHLTIRKDETLYIFTDGSYEFRVKEKGKEKTKEFGLRKFSRVLKSLPLVAWRESLLPEIQKANGSEIFDDDITILRLHRSP